MAKKFTFHQLARYRGHVDRDKWAMATPAIIVQHARNQFFASPALAVDHHRKIGLSEPGQDAIDFLHGGRATD